MEITEAMLIEFLFIGLVAGGLIGYAIRWVQKP